VAERDPEKHRDIRRLLSHGFSAKALSEQESIMQEYTDMFIAQLKSLGGGKDGLNMKEVGIRITSFRCYLG
jgi:cytochrome P450